MRISVVATVSHIILASIAALATLIASACSSQNAQPAKWPDAPPCINNIVGVRVRSQLEHVVDGFGEPGAALATELVRQTCDKQIYRRGRYRIVLYTVPHPPAEETPEKMIWVSGYAEAEHGDLTATEDAACLKRASGDLSGWGVEETLLDKFRAKFPEYYDDPEVGPAHYLSCSGIGPLSYQRSLAVMVHELTHQLSDAKCLYISYPPGQLCFMLPDTLPSVSIATVDNLVASDDKYLKRLGKAQEMYLIEFSKLNRGPLFLFNELNAYTAGLEVSTAVLKHQGPAGLLLPDGKPEPSLLPLVMLWSAKYLNAMGERDPDFFSETLAPGTDNGSNIEALLTHAESAYAAWSKEMERRKLEQNPAEKDLWRKYLEIRKPKAS
jgi:hypothetical protein